MTNTEVSPSVRTDSTSGCTTQGPGPSPDSSSSAGPPSVPSKTTTPRPPAPTHGFTTATGCADTSAIAAGRSSSLSTTTVGTTGTPVAASSVR